MNEAQGSGTMHDSVGYPNNGRLPGTVSPRGTFYRFAGGAAIVVPNQAELNPGKRDVDVTVRFRWSERREISLIQKGLFNAHGGQWKVELDTDTGVSCWFRGHILNVHDALSLNAWHTLKCSKRANSISLTIDGTPAGSLATVVGSVSNTSPVTVGGKPSCPHGDCDYFRGDIDYASVTYP